MIRLNGQIVEQNHFPDGTLLLKHETEIFDVQIIEWFFENNEELVSLIFLTKHLREYGVETLHLYMPYLPNARQDRTKESEDVFTLKYFCEVINSLKFDKVIILDPHSSVSEALLDRVGIEPPTGYISKAYDAIRKDIKRAPLMMFYPDEGSMKRYSSMALGEYALASRNVIGKQEKLKDSMLPDV